MNTHALWFHDNGIGTFPIRTPGKTPACKSWDDFIATREQVGRFKNFGVRLGLLAVVDSDSADTEACVAASVPFTPFVVQTARGRHRYFRLAGDAPKFIYRDGLTIEFRHAGQYVVGPGSVHQSGAVYTAADWSWNLDDVPFFPAGFLFNDGSCGKRSTAATPGGEPYEFPDEVRAGARHAELFKQIRSFKALGLDKASTREMIGMLNQSLCKPPIKEDADFSAWFDRAWGNPDRPLKVRAVVDPFGGDVL